MNGFRSLRLQSVFSKKRAMRIASAAMTLTFCIAQIPVVDAANLYWAGMTDGRFEKATNWVTVHGGTTNPAAYPGSSDVAIFAGGSGSTVTIRSNVTVQGILLTGASAAAGSNPSGWTGSLLQGTGTIKVTGATGIRIGSGYFVGGNGLIQSTSTSGSGYTQTGGIVTGIQNVLSLSGSFKIAPALTAGGFPGKTTFTSTGTIVFSGNARQYFTVGKIPKSVASIKNVTVKKAPTSSTNSVNTVTVSGSSLSLSGALTITTGRVDLTTNSVRATLGGDVTISNTGVLLTNSNVSHSGALTVAYNAALAPTGGTWTSNATKSQTYTLNGLGKVFQAFTLNNSGGSGNRSLSFAGSGVTLSGALTITAGTFDLTTNSQALVARGITMADAAAAGFSTNSNVTNSGAVTFTNHGPSSASFTMSAGTWTQYDQTEQVHDFAGKQLYNFTLNNTGCSSCTKAKIHNTFNLSGALTLTLGSLILGSGGVITGNATLANSSSVAMAVTGSQILTLGGDWTHNPSATFTANSSTVVFNGSTQTLSGATSFVNLTRNTAGTLTLHAGSTVNVTGNLTLNGTSSSTLKLRSNTSGTRARIYPTGPVSVSYVDVQDNANDGTTIYCINLGCVDSGNNVRWSISNATAASTTTSSSTTATGAGGGGGGRHTVSLPSTAATAAVTNTTKVTPVSNSNALTRAITTLQKRLDALQQKHPNQKSAIRSLQNRIKALSRRKR